MALLDEKTVAMLDALSVANTEAYDVDTIACGCDGNCTGACENACDGGCD